MEKLSICRICLDNNSQHVIEDPQLHELYERLTKIPFQTGDMRPLSLCYICHAQLNSARRLMLKCLKAEEILTNALYRVTYDDQAQNTVLIDRSSLQELAYTIVPVIFDNAGENSGNTKEDMLKMYETNVELEEVMQEIVNSIDFKLDDENKQSISGPGGDVSLNNIQAADQEAAGERDDKRRVKRAAPIRKKPKPKAKGTKKQKSKRSNFSNSREQTPKIRLPIKENVCCDKCNRVFKEKCYLIAHRCTGKYHPYSCDVCNKSFTAKRKLIKHLRTHMPVKPYPCNLCEKSFCERKYLILHTRIHTDVKSCVCKVCNKCFRTKSGLNVHSRVHTGVRPYVCNVCERRFTVSGHVVRHARLHTGEKPYVCAVCDRKFNQNSSLTLHFRCMHGKATDEKLETTKSC